MKSDKQIVRPIVEVIAEQPFFSELSKRHLETLAQNAMQKRFQAGEIIFREGDPANCFYLIEQGKVALESKVRDHDNVIIQILGVGKELGWEWLFPPCYELFNARVLEPTQAIFFYGTRLRARCEEDHDLGYELMSRMAQVVIRRLQATRRQLVDNYARCEGDQAKSPLADGE